MVGMATVKTARTILQGIRQAGKQYNTLHEATGSQSISLCSRQECSIFKNTTEKPDCVIVQCG